MPKLKHNFHKLKFEFFTSEFSSVFQFFENKDFKRDFSGGFGGHIEENTRGWAKEKKQLEQKIYKKALKEYKDERTFKWKETFTLLDQARLNQLNEFAVLLIKGSVSNGYSTLNKFDPRKMRVVKGLIDILTYIDGIMGKPPQPKTEPNEEKSSLTEEDIQALKDLNLF